MDAHTGQSAEAPVWFVEQLPPKLRTTALLVLTGHSKRLLRMNEPALRQRIADIRRALLPSVRSPDVVLASHDPDGNLFVVSTSRKPGARQLGSGSNHLKE